MALIQEYWLDYGRYQNGDASEAARPLDILLRGKPEMPANRGLLRIGGRSLGSGFGRFGLGLADSLRRIFEIFPFSGDSDRRPGSIGTAGEVSRLSWQNVDQDQFAARDLNRPSIRAD